MLGGDMTTTTAQADRDVQPASALAPPVRRSIYQQTVLDRMFATPRSTRTPGCGGGVHGAVLDR
jgi:hypothetical protein